ncbi:unnamed protein product [Hyaloperonospora brassicae]|uniref:Surfeit locus protein 2 n=1 Tax=Hyaloperonospora brassicae TaxID=162125 RepID=A0AAV0TCV0_HYABA|nr:unnamed protein product [Hyaloperonospora brassicae]
MAAPASSLEPALQQLLDQHEFLEVLETGGHDEPKRVRVKCQLTQHEMLPRADVVTAHLTSKKFCKARDWYCHDYSQYEPYIVPHRRLPKCLFCNVTSTILNRIPAEVEKHVQGKRYKRMKEHVKVQVSKGDKNGNDKTQSSSDRDFDADLFEFENSQVIYSDEEDEQRDDNDESDEREGRTKASQLNKDENDDDDMADLYPDDDDMEEGKDSGARGDDTSEATDEATDEASRKKRRATSHSGSKKTRHRSKQVKNANSCVPT